MGKEILGTDLKLVNTESGKDLSTLFGDLETVAGEDNLVQALTLRLTTKKGGLKGVGHPDYGSQLHELIGRPNTQMTRDLVKLYCKECILQDPRVKEIRSIVVETKNRALGEVEVHAQVVPIESNTPLNLVLSLNIGG